MIKIVAARGSYSHHLTNLLAVGTNLTTISEFFQLSDTGDSHSIRTDPIISSTLITSHFKHLMLPPIPGEKFIVIQPDREHILDYVDNSFSKESKYRCDDWFAERLINREFIPEHYFSSIIEFLKSNDIWSIDARTLAPENKPWMIREFLSYRILNLMFSCYERYFMLTYSSKIKSTDFFDNFESALTELVYSLDLEFKIPMSKIVDHNNLFVRHQRYHGIQNRCDRYVGAVINNEYAENPCITIFDEAYVQAKLREYGWEIMVDNLNKLPDSYSLSKLIYRAELKSH